MLLIPTIEKVKVCSCTSFIVFIYNTNVELRDSVMTYIVMNVSEQYDLWSFIVNKSKS